MNEERKIINLKGGETFITNKGDDAYRVISGSILVYIVPIKKGVSGRRSFVYEASANETLPGFCYRDIEYCEWRFCFVALEQAEFQVIENGTTNILKQKFSQKAKIKNYAKEGYFGGLVDQYRTNIVREDGFIRRSQYARSENAHDILSLIYNSFSKKKLVFEDEKSDNLIYDAVSILCEKKDIKVAPYEKIKEACNSDIAVSDIARVSHFAYREILLTNGWEKEDGDSFIAFNTQKKPIVCLSRGTNKYVLWDVESGSVLPTTKKVIETITPKAYMVYRPFPNKELNWKDIVKFCTKSIRVADIIMLSFLTIATSLIGLLTPSISQSIYDNYIPLGAKSILFQFGCILGSFMIANIMFSIVKNLSSFRITSRMAYDMQSAVYDRLFNLPESFFRNYESADLAQRIMGTSSIVNSIGNIVTTSLVALVFSIVYISRMFKYSAKLTILGMIMLLVYGVLYYFVAFQAIKHKTKSAEINGKTSSIMFQFLNGISKIRIAGVEDRAIYEYLKPYVKERDCEEKAEKSSDMGNVINLISGSIFSIVFYLIIIKSHTDISLGAFIAFNSLFGAFSAYFLQLVSNAISYKNQKPNIERLRPVLKALPEFDDAKELPGDVSGAIEINNVTFRYSDDAPYVLDGISLNIKPGEYVGLVGSSGCGKSTLMKLLLGFEKPTSGKIYYDNKDIESVDKRELRKKMGVVLQDGKLISGSIFENITITAPNAKLKDVNEVVAAVGLKKDIEQMPMGLHTVLSEDCGTISGGQQQRILIARAIISNPKILFFDEATSALDNITQSMVCETLEKMNSTRIVIAHRLSTIIKCDRIIVLDGGKIVEQGTYDELMQNNGLFYKLASRQTV